MTIRGFQRVPNAAIKDGLIAAIGTNAFAVLTVLRSYAGGRANAWPSRQRLMALTGIRSSSTFARCIKVLEDYGLVRCDRRTGQTTVYRLAKGWPSNWVHDSKQFDNRTTTCTEIEPTSSKIEPEPVRKSNRKKIKERRDNKNSEEDIETARRILNELRGLLPPGGRDDIDAWSAAVARLKTSKGYSDDTIRATLSACSPFWKSKVTLPGKFEEHFDKMYAEVKASELTGDELSVNAFRDRLQQARRNTKQLLGEGT